MKPSPYNAAAVALSLILLCVSCSDGFQNSVPATTFRERSRSVCGGHYMSDPNDSESKSSSKPKSFLDDLKGMFQNFDDVVDDFVYKRMGAGEQWYGKRKYNPSGRVEGDYNGMGRSDYFRIEVARVQKEEMERRKQRRLEEEEEARKRGR